MKKHVLMAVLATSSVAFATPAQDAKEIFEIQSANYSPAHIQFAGSGTISVDHSQSQLILHIERKMPTCPVGQKCLQILPVPMVISLPLKSVETDSCGVRSIIAESDERPSDGKLSQLTITDTSEQTCPTLVPNPSAALYKTSYFDRLSGSEVTDISTMQLATTAGSEPSVRYELASGKLIKGFSPGERLKTGSLQLAVKGIELELNLGTTCKGPICPMYVPMPLFVRAPIVSLKETKCGDFLTARLEPKKAGDRTIEIQIVDYSHALCRMKFNHPVQATYIEKGKRNKIEKKAELFFK